MGKSKEKDPNSKEGRWERLHRFGRNWNALGAVALGGLAVVVPVGGAVLGTLAGINAVQAGGFEAARRHVKKKRLKKSKNSNTS
ncbi:hypothetical protein BH23PAT1_BH23PAT1_0400 [soil metagenome]